MPRPTLKKRADGRYRCKYHDQYFYGATVSEAFAARDAYIHGERTAQAREHLVRYYAANWLRVHKAHVSGRTYDDYSRYVDTLIAELGDRPVGEVTVSEIKASYATRYLTASASALHKARMLYISIWDTAVEEGVAKRNPCRSEQARPHKGTAGTHRQLTPEEDALLLQVDHPFKYTVLAMRYAGLRRGEALALDIDRDVDFDRKVIYVREAVQFDENTPTVKTPKTEAGVRVIPLFSILEKALQGRHGLLAPSASGKLMTATAFRRAWNGYKSAFETALNGGREKRWYGRKREDQGAALPPWQPCTIRTHDLRHSYCTMLRDAGVDLKLAIEWMGHADERLILRIYDHITEARIRTAIAKYC